MVTASITASDLLTQGATMAKGNADLMQMCLMAIHTDEGLRETLKSSQGKLHEWEAATKGVPQKLQEEVSELKQELDSATAARRSHLVEKRKLQMSVRDERGRAERADKKLEELKGQLEQSAGGDVKIMEAEVMGLRRDLEGMESLKAEAVELRGKVAELTTQLETEKESAGKRSELEAKLQRDIEELEERQNRPAAAVADSHHHPPPAPPTRPRTDRKRKEPKEPKEKPIQPDTMLTPPVLGAGSLVLLSIGFLIGSTRGGSGGGSGAAAPVVSE